MKICFIGLGSIGTRHANNLCMLLKQRKIDVELHALRSGVKDSAVNIIQGTSIKEFYDIDKLSSDYDVIFIANPTAMHYETLKEVIKYSRYIFLEKPAFEKSSYDISFLSGLDKKRIYIACPLRYTNVIEYLKQIVKAERVFCARVICSTYLPDWRPGVDYRTTYSAHSNMGGGVDIDLIHEMDYIVHLFGFPENIISQKGQYSNLDLESVDFSSYVLDYKDKAVSIHLDYFGRYPQRKIEIYTEDELIVGDLINHNLEYKVSGKHIDFSENRNDYQIKELETFIDIVLGSTTNDNDIAHAINVLKLAEGRC